MAEEEAAEGAIVTQLDSTAFSATSISQDNGVVLVHGQRSWRFGTQS